MASVVIVYHSGYGHQAPPAGDLATARQFGARIAHTALRWKKGRG